MTYYHETLWFERLFGCEESGYDQVKEDIACQEEEEGLSYLTGPNKKKLVTI